MTNLTGTAADPGWKPRSAANPTNDARIGSAPAPILAGSGGNVRAAYQPPAGNGGFESLPPPLLEPPPTDEAPRPGTATSRPLARSGSPTQGMVIPAPVGGSPFRRSEPPPERLSLGNGAQPPNEIPSAPTPGAAAPSSLPEAPRAILEPPRTGDMGPAEPAPPPRGPAGPNPAVEPGGSPFRRPLASSGSNTTQDPATPGARNGLQDLPAALLEPPRTDAEPERRTDPNSTGTLMIGPNTPRTPRTPAQGSTNASSTPTAASGSSDSSILLSAARNAANRNDLEQAIARYEEYLEKKPDDQKARQEYAGILVRVGRAKKAVDQYRSLIQANPNDDTLRAALADVLFASQDYKQAIQELKVAQEAKPEDVAIAVKLARAYALNNDQSAAFRLLDAILNNLKPGASKPGDKNDDLARRGVVALLLDLQRPRDALEFLNPLLVQKPEDIELLGYLIRISGRLGQRDKAVEAITTMAKIVGAIDERLALAESLVGSDDLDLATLIYAQVLEKDPANASALIGAARVNIRLFKPREAYQILKSLQPNGVTHRAFMLAWAEYHRLVGEYADAKNLYRSLLSRDASDLEVLLALGSTYAEMGEHEKAKAEFATIPPDTAQGRQAQLSFARILSTQRRFHEAKAHLHRLLSEEPNDIGARALLAHIYGRTGESDQAISLARSYLQGNPRNEAAVVGTHIILARSLLDAKKFMEALREYETALTLPGGRNVAVWYGIVKSQEKLGHPDKGQEALVSAVGLPEMEVRHRLLLADEFTADYDDVRAGIMIDAALRGDPENLAALIRKADNELRMSRVSGNAAPPASTAQSILKRSTTNIRAFFTLARAQSTAQDYKAAITTYKELIGIDSEATAPRRELARILYADHQYEAANAVYNQMPVADDMISTDLAALAQRDPNVKVVADRSVKAGYSGKELQGELDRLGKAGTDEAQISMLHLANRYDAYSADQTAASLESAAKNKKGVRNYEAIPAYDSLLAVEPGSTEGLFDLGQIYSGLQHTHKAISTYNQLLQVDPEHREAAVARQRASLELQPQSWTTFSFFGQRGRNGLAAVDRYRFGEAIRLPYGDENEFYEFGFSRVRFDPVDDPPLDGNIFSFRVQKKYPEWTLFYAQVNYEDYANRLHDRITFDMGVRCTPWEPVQFRAGIFLEPVVENGESIRQSIYRTGLRLGATSQPTRRWSFGGDYTLASYSDDNIMNELFLFNNIILMYPPTQLRLAMNVDFLTYSQQTIFVNPDPRILFGTIHPYFAPDGWAFYETRLEWLHYLSRDYFAHANVCYYGLQYGLGWDSSFYTYNTIRALFNYDIKPWFSIGADARITRSQVYDVNAFSIYAILRLPHFHQ